MQLVTRDTLAADVARRLHLTFDERTKPITLSDLHIELAESCDTLSGMIRAIDVGDDYLTRSQLVTIPAGESTIDFADTLNGTFLALKKVSWMETSDRTSTLRHAGIDELHADAGWGAGWTSATPTYRLMGAGIQFYPTPLTDVRVIVTYAASIVTSADDSWSAAMGPGWRRWIVADVARKVLLADNKPDMARLYEVEADTAWQRIILTNMERDEYVLRGVRNVEPEFGFDPWIPQRFWGGW